MTDLSWLTARPIAHRGLHDMNSSVWENTLPAFARAIERGYAIECDVHLSADGDAVVFHDNDLKRLTGDDGFVWQRTAAELAALRIGGTADHPPTLQEMLDLVAGRVPLVIELKGIAGHDEGLVERGRQAAAVLSRQGGDHVLRPLAAARLCRAHAPGIPAGLTAYGTERSATSRRISRCSPTTSPSSPTDLAACPTRFVAFVRDRLDMPVITWTVRDPAAVAHRPMRLPTR